MKPFIDRAMREAGEEEPWDGYYMTRGGEMEKALEFVSVPDLGRVLDIGCGNGFTSFILLKRAKKVVAGDLYAPDAKKHSLGLNAARRFRSRFGIRDMPLVGASIKKLPFKNGVFDTVFAAYVLQYLKDRRLALGELKRVTKEDGLIILMLPNFLERVWAFFQYYIYLAIKAAGLMINPRGKKGVSDGIEKLSKNYSYFPFPGPHGAYRTGAQELVRHLPALWNKEFKENGFRIRRSFTTTFAPYPLLLTVSLKLASIVSRSFEGLTRFLGAKPIIKYLGYNYCVVLKND